MQHIHNPFHLNCTPFPPFHPLSDPITELLPEKRMLFFPNLAKLVGSRPLARRIEALRPDAHVFGHTHIGWDGVVRGVRFLQSPLGYPHERKAGIVHTQEPLCLYDTEKGFPAEHYPFHWSDHYRTTARNPHILDLAPWVAPRYA
eukprot:m.47888 g.47888  ORF g.47888 m.47888 type:complete len:145 (-) comp12679_c1_seq1:246-680(-)